MVDVINDPFKEKSKYYFKIGETLSLRPLNDGPAVAIAIGIFFAM